MNKILTVEAIKENSWFSVELPIPEKASEVLLIEIYHITAVLAVQTQIQQAEALRDGDIQEARNLHVRCEQIETRAELARVMLKSLRDNQKTAIFDGLNQTPPPSKISVELEAAGESAPSQYSDWFKRKGGIDGLNLNERLALSADYCAWTKKKPEAALKHTEADYCAFRQIRWAQEIAKQDAKQPTRGKLHAAEHSAVTL